MILYLAAQEHTNLLDFLNQHDERTLPVKKMTGNFMLEQFVVYDMRNFSHCSEFVLDRIAFGDKDAGFAEAIKGFLTMYNARITVIYEGLQPQDQLFIDLLEAGVGNIVTETEIYSIQEEILQSLSKQGMTKYSPIKHGKPETGDEHYQFTAKNITIAIIGSQTRMGTTTVALGFVAWLGNAGASACYVEANESGCLRFIADAYEMEAVEEGYRLENVYYGSQTYERDFQFIVYDHGAAANSIQADLILLVCGTKPYELLQTMKLLQHYKKQSAFVLCPFVDAAFRNTYTEALHSDYHKVLFLSYQPDCMDGGPNAKSFKTVVETYIAGS